MISLQPLKWAITSAALALEGLKERRKQGLVRMGVQFQQAPPTQDHPHHHSVLRKWAGAWLL